MAELVDVSCDFTVRLPGRGKGTVHAVDDVDLAVTRGETLGLVGESGSGKSTLARLLLRLIRPTAGRVLLGGEDITRRKGARLRTLRRRMQLVFQDPYSSFDPLATIGSSVGEALVGPYRLGRSQAREQSGRPNCSTRSGSRRPSPADAPARSPEASCSGRPSPEPWPPNPSSWRSTSRSAHWTSPPRCRWSTCSATSRTRLGIAYLFISHDLNLVRSLSHRVAVMYLGRIVEEGPVEDLYGSAHHPYTQALLSASPSLDPARRQRDRAGGRHPFAHGPAEWLSLPDPLPPRHGGVRSGGTEGHGHRRADQSRCHHMDRDQSQVPNPREPPHKKPELERRGAPRVRGRVR